MNIRKLKKKKIKFIKIDQNQEEIATENLFNLSHFDDFHPEDYSAILKSVDLGKQNKQISIKPIAQNKTSFINKNNPESTGNLFLFNKQTAYKARALLKLYSTVPHERSSNPSIKSKKHLLCNSFTSSSVFVGKKKSFIESETSQKKGKSFLNYQSIIERKFQNQKAICLRSTIYNPRSNCFSPQQKTNFAHFQACEKRNSRLKTLDLEIDEDFLKVPSKRNKKQKKAFFDNKMPNSQLKYTNKQISMNDSVFANRTDVKNINRLTGYKKS